MFVQFKANQCLQTLLEFNNTDFLGDTDCDRFQYIVMVNFSIVIVNISFIAIVCLYACGTRGENVDRTEVEDESKLTGSSTDDC